MLSILVLYCKLVALISSLHDVNGMLAEWYAKLTAALDIVAPLRRRLTGSRKKKCLL